jgi:hypothetical protein
MTPTDDRAIDRRLLILSIVQCAPMLGAMLMHLVMTGILLHEPKADLSIALAGFRVFPVIRQPMNLALFMSAASVMAMAALLRQVSGKVYFSLMAPQQLLLVVPAVSAIVAIINGRYADGYVPSGSHWFVLADQLVRIIFAMTHSATLYLTPQLLVPWSRIRQWLRLSVKRWISFG